MNKLTISLRDHDISQLFNLTLEWSENGLEIHPGGTDTKGGPIWLEHHEGTWKLYVWDDKSQEDYTHKITFEKAMRDTPVAPIRLNATYSSVWDNGSTVTTPCHYDPENKVCSGIKTSDVEIDAGLDDEYVTYMDEDLRAKDGVTFEY